MIQIVRAWRGRGLPPLSCHLGCAEKGRDKHGHPGDDPDAVAKYGMTLLMRASKPGDGAVFELLRAGMQGRPIPVRTPSPAS